MCFFQKATSSSFDECVIILSCLSDHESMVTLLTKEMCTPMPLCAPEHSRHMRAPYVTEAHCGWFEPQSTHLSLPGKILISACMAGVMETAIWLASGFRPAATAGGFLNQRPATDNGAGLSLTSAGDRRRLRAFLN